MTTPNPPDDSLLPEDALFPEDEALDVPDAGPRVETIIAPEEAAGIRLDTFLSRRQNQHSRTFFQQLIKDSKVTLNGAHEKGSVELKPGDEIVVHYPPAEDPWPIPQDLPIEVLYHNDDFILVNKESGMITHPAPGNPDGTLVNALLHHFPDLPGINGVKRPGIVHRLDRETSGIMVVAKSDLAMTRLAKQIMDRRMSRLYIAMILGTPDWTEKTIEAPIGRHEDMRIKRRVGGVASRTATTHFRVLLCGDGFSLVRCQLDTGRTHQIRVHAEYMGFPIVGDDLYGGIAHRSLEKLMNTLSDKRRAFQALKRTFLHARVLTFQDPQNGEWVTGHAPLPTDLRRIFDAMFPGYDCEPYLKEKVKDERPRDVPTRNLTP